MATQQERLRILKMIEGNKITAEEGAKLISALAASRKAEKDERKPGATKASGRARSLRIRVTNAKTSKQQVNVSLPIGLVDIALKIGARFSSQLNGVDVSEIVQSIQDGTLGKIIDVSDEKGGDHVEIFVE